MNNLTIQEFKKQAKELAVSFGLKKSDISITADIWIKIRLSCQDQIQFSNLQESLEKLAGYEDNSEIWSNYYDHSIKVKNKYECSYGGLLIMKS